MKNRTVKNVSSKMNAAKKRRMNKAKENTAARLAQRRATTLYNLRPPATNTHKSKFDELGLQVNSMTFYMAIGHGTHIRDPPQFVVPPNVYIVFMTPAGYWGNIKDVLYDDKFREVFESETKIKHLIKDTLPQSNKPKIITKKGWDWKNHIYGPGKTAPMHRLEMYDREQKDISKDYDAICGFHKLPFGRHNAELKGAAVTLDVLATKAFMDTVASSKKFAVLFVYGCRGDPAVPYKNMQNVFKQHMYSAFSAYNVPKAANSYIQAMRNAERARRENMSKVEYNRAAINAEINRLPKGANGYVPWRVRRLVNKYPNAQVKKYIIDRVINKEVASGASLNRLVNKYDTGNMGLARLFGNGNRNIIMNSLVGRIKLETGVKALTRLQARWRGHLARKKVAEIKARNAALEEISRRLAVQSQNARRWAMQRALANLPPPGIRSVSGSVRLPPPPRLNRLRTSRTLLSRTPAPGRSSLLASLENVYGSLN